MTQRLLKTGVVREGIEEILMLRDDGYRIWVSWHQGKPEGEDYDGEHLWAEYKQCNFPSFSQPITDLLMEDPAIELRHSLKSALDECDELRAKNKEQERIMAIMETEIDSLRVDVAEHKKAHEIVSKSAVGSDLLKLGMKQQIEALEMRVLALTHENEKLKEANANLRQNYIAALSCEDESDQDYKDEIVSVMQRITTALGLSWSCTDYDPADIEKLEREIERLQEALERAKSIAHSRGENIDQLRSVVNQNKEIFAKDKRLLAVLEDRYNKIDILEDNLERADSDRLAELTSIMRMVQALEETPQDKLSGAIYLIKRVIYEQICKLDPSQSL